MKTGVLRGLSEEQNLEKQIEKQMGCVAGFLQIFDRHQVIAGKRIYSTKRLPSFPAVSSTSPSEKSEGSVSSFSKDPPSPTPQQSPDRPPSSPESLGSARPSLRLPVFEFKEGLRSSWKLREAPRLSLDSRAIVDGKGKLFPREIRTTSVCQSGSQPDGSSEAADDLDNQRRSPSVVARLMGLDALPNYGGSGRTGDDVPFKRAELRRSASESRASRDLLQFQLDGRSSQKPPSLQGSTISDERLKILRQYRVCDFKPEPSPRVALSPPPPTAFSALQKKSFFDAQDYFFPEPLKRGGSIYGDIEKRLRMHGIDEPAKDLEALKQVLEALQLKGLLHSKQQQCSGGAKVLHHRNNVRNLVFDRHQIRSNFSGESPIVLMKPAPRFQSPRSPPPLHLRSSVSLPTRRNHLAASETASPGRMARADQVEIDRSPVRSNERRMRNARRPDPGEARSPSSLAGRSTGASNSGNTLRGRNNTDRRIPSVQSRKPGSLRKVRSDSDPTSRSPRNRSLTGEISPREGNSDRADDESSAVSEGSLSASSKFDFERVKTEYRQGRSLLERCDKLLHSIAEITSGIKGSDEDAEQANTAEQQPSPVSVLDTAGSFYSDEAASPSATVMKRSIDFKDRSAECIEERWNPSIPSVQLKQVDELDVDEGDFLYVSEILTASDHNRTVDIFSSLEKQQHQKRDDSAASSKASRLHRRLVFDTVAEIVGRRSQVSSWEAFSQSRSPLPAGKGKVLPSQVWAELRRIQEPVPADDLCDVIRGVLRKDMMTAAERGWGDDRSLDLSDAVLDIERLIFKDLVAETIQDLAATTYSSGRCRGAPATPPSTVGAVPRKKLVF